MVHQGVTDELLAPNLTNGAHLIGKKSCRKSVSPFGSKLASLQHALWHWRPSQITPARTVVATIEEVDDTGVGSTLSRSCEFSQLGLNPERSRWSKQWTHDWNYNIRSNRIKQGE